MFIYFVFRLFRECPHPDDKQRKELSRALGLELLQVKFWFQNKRTQIKVIIMIIHKLIKVKYSEIQVSADHALE